MESYARQCNINLKNINFLSKNFFQTLAYMQRRAGGHPNLQEGLPEQVKKNKFLTRAHSHKKMQDHVRGLQAPLRDPEPQEDVRRRGRPQGRRQGHPGGARVPQRQVEAGPHKGEYACSGCPQ